MFCYFGTKSLDEFMTLQQQANMEIVKAIGESGASLALPSSVIHFDDESVPTTSEVISRGASVSTKKSTSVTTGARKGSK